MIDRRRFASLLTAVPIAGVGCTPAPKAQSDVVTDGFSYLPGITSTARLIAPTARQIKVAFVINPGVQVIDVAGPWETFQDTVATLDAEDSAFTMFTVSETVRPVRVSGGLMIVPDFSIADAPQPDLIVVPHFDRPRPASRETSGVHAWILQAHEQAALTMSVCTGAFQLAKTGLLDGIPMTTNKLASDNFARSFPEIDLRRGPRFVEAGRIATSGGLSAGIDLALRVVSRYFDESVARRTATTMEYAGTGWRV